jgi:hypothetical protein
MSRGRGGMILRNGPELIGYCLHSLEQREETELYIHGLTVRKDKRSGGVSRGFIKELRKLANSLDAKVIAWDLISPDMKTISHKIGAERLGRYTIKTEDFDVQNLVEMGIDSKDL